jgi:hypothetical protein
MFLGNAVNFLTFGLQSWEDRRSAKPEVRDQRSEVRDQQEPEPQKPKVKGKELIS